ncbi:serpin family protein [Nannocystaceae bacterium ST9]
MTLRFRPVLIAPVLLTPVLFAAGCTSPTDPGDEGDGDGAFEEARSDEPHDENPQVTPAEAAALADANHGLALDLYHELREGQAAGKGFSISPYSIQTAFGMLYAGTVEPARAEMAAVLHFPLEGERQHVGNNWIDSQLVARKLPALVDDPEFGDQDPVVLDTANGVWVRKDLAPQIAAPYLDTLAIHYDAGLYLADFRSKPDAERMGINAWVSERTNDLIPELLPAGVITVDTTMVLVNAMYLKAPWADPFDAMLTVDAAFTRLDGTTLDVPMMHSGELEAGYAEGEGWQALAVPMRGEALELVLIVPDDFAAFEAGLDAATLDGVFDTLTTGIVDASLPRFSLDTQLELVPELRALGMSAAFDDSSSFDDILPDLGVITAVVHQTVIKVDEKGTEAAAATGIVVGETSVPEPDATIVVDRPFVLAIRDQPSDTLLFLGRVLEPS